VHPLHPTDAGRLAFRCRIGTILWSVTHPVKHEESLLGIGRWDALVMRLLWVSCIFGH
jgi:hypothetical protein